MNPDLQAAPNKPPSHVAIIMDGNGRWAKLRGLPRIEGHRRGVNNVQDILKGARDCGVKYLTLYAFSVENWNRPQKEIDALMTMLERFLKAELKGLIKNRIRLRVIGRPEELPEKVQGPLTDALEATAGFDDWHLIVALNYGSRMEVVDAVKRYAEAVTANREKPENLRWERFARYLYTGDIPDPDLLIRTSGETRLSNFLLLQCAYSEMYFTSTFWPDFGKTAFKKAIETYMKRERRFGKTGEQIKEAFPEPLLNQ